METRGISTAGRHVLKPLSKKLKEKVPHRTPIMSRGFRVLNCHRQICLDPNEIYLDVALSCAHNDRLETTNTQDHRPIKQTKKFYQTAHLCLPCNLVKLARSRLFAD
eukprot:1196380-Prorocentrum_minimum.AAC.8